MKKVFPIIIAIIIIVCGVLVFFYFQKEPEKVIEAVPYVEENDIEILSAKEEYQNPVYIYTQDKDGKTIDIEEVEFKDSVKTYNFYDYSVSEEDENGYVTYSFKYDSDMEIEYKSIKNQNYSWYYSYSSVSPGFFDYYTGDMYYVNSISLDNRNVVLLQEDKSDDDEDKYKYTDITWNNKTYKIGVYTETESEWQGNKLLEDTNEYKKYGDTDKSKTTVYIYAPKDYDGLMVSILKRGSSKESFLNQMEQNNRYLELKKEAEETGEKSEELLKIEEKINRLTKLFESVYNENLKYTKDDFYVFRVSDIKPSE